jgi:hypothetical protein
MVVLRLKPELLSEQLAPLYHGKGTAKLIQLPSYTLGQNEMALLVCLQAQNW